MVRSWKMRCTMPQKCLKFSVTNRRQEQFSILQLQWATRPYRTQATFSQMKLTWRKLLKTFPLMASLQEVHKWWYRKQQQQTNLSYPGCTCPGLQIPRLGWQAEHFKESKMGLISAAELENNLAVYAVTPLHCIRQATYEIKARISNLLVAVPVNALGTHTVPLDQKSAASGGYRGAKSSILKSGRRFVRFVASEDFATHWLDAYHLQHFQHSAYKRSHMNTCASAATKRFQTMKPFLSQEKLERTAVPLWTVRTSHWSIILFSPPKFWKAREGLAAQCGLA